MQGRGHPRVLVADDQADVREALRLTETRDRATEEFGAEAA